MKYLFIILSFFGLYAFALKDPINTEAIDGHVKMVSLPIPVTNGALTFFLTADTLYVRTWGSDANVGTYASPFATINGAQSYFHTHTTIGPVLVYVEGGVYQSPGWTFTENTTDSNRKITYQGFNGTPENIGGIVVPDSAIHLCVDTSITNRIQSAARSHIYSIDLATIGLTAASYGLLRVTDNNQQPNAQSGMELFVNKHPYHLACYPNSTGQYNDNDSLLKIGGVGTPLPIGPGTKDASFSYAVNGSTVTTRIAGWKKIPGVYGGNSWASIWIRGTLAYDYTSDNMPLDSIQTASDTVYCGGRPQNAIYPSTTTGVSQVVGSLLGFYFYNVLEELDAPGEWYLDSANHKLYIYGDASLLTAKVELSTTGGTYPTNIALLALQNCSNMYFNGIDFECTRGEGVNFTKCSGAHFYNCHFRNFGGMGIRGFTTSSTGNQGITFNYCTFSGMGEGCLYLDGSGTGGNFRTTLTPSGNSVRNCEFYDWSRNYRAGSAGITLSGVGDTVMSCHFHDDPDVAINFQGNNHYIDSNRIVKVCWKYGDQGAIYTDRDPSSTGTIIINNLFDSVNNLGHAFAEVSAIYIDDQSGGITIEFNIFNNCGSGGHGAIHINGGGYNILANNTFRNCILAHSGNIMTQAAWNAYWIHGAGWTIVSPYVTLALYQTTYSQLANFGGDTTSLTNPLNNNVNNELFSNCPYPLFEPTSGNWVVTDTASAPLIFKDTINYIMIGTPSQTSGWSGWFPWGGRAGNYNPSIVPYGYFGKKLK